MIILIDAEKKLNKILHLPTLNIHRKVGIKENLINLIYYFYENYNKYLII